MTGPPDRDQSESGAAPAKVSAAEELRSIYESNFAYVFRSLRRLGIPSRDLEDVAHDVFVVVHRKLADYDRARPIKPWLFGICFRVASDFLRRAPRRREVLEEAAEPVSGAPSAEDEVAGREARALVIEALQSIAEDRRPVFIMAEIDGVPVPEIAAVIGIPLNTAYSRLRLARGEFAAAVRRLDGAPARPGAPQTAVRPLAGGGTPP